MDNPKPETGAFFQRDRLWHPPAFTPGYKTSVTRSPRYALLSLNNMLSELTGPVFGHSMIGKLDNIKWPRTSAYSKKHPPKQRAHTSISA
jgi:protocatechuate 3,4-dioxygenase beta subunit